jgi:erythromycin esterase
MAATVRLLRTLHGEDTRIVLMLHNGHLQRLPFVPFPGLVMPSAGTHLAAEFGDDYFALGLTAGGGITTSLIPDPDARLAFRVSSQPLDPPVPGSVEQALAGSGPSLVDLRANRAKGTAGPAGIRHAHLNSPVDVVEAFDALLYVPETTVSGHVDPPG